MRIVSRLKDTEIQHDRLRGVLEVATDGDISPHGSTTPGDTLEKLVDQVEDVVLDYMERVETLEESYDCLQSEVLALSAQCGTQERILNTVTEGVHYDEALDYATIDLMDALLGSGAANTTFDGDLSFDESVVFSKEDLKPILRQAIDTWICNKVR